MIETGGGAYDPTDRLIYFLACSPGQSADVAYPVHPYILVAVNNLVSAKQLAFLDAALAAGVKVFIDSGIFTLVMDHARKHRVSMEDALALRPDKIDGFNALWARYVAVVEQYGDRAWGYVELDQGGAVCKRETRARLEAMGLRPIPVYHPINDGWDYFEELAQSYDRIAVGNLVHADAPTRRRLTATLHQRSQAYPNLWIHLLGVTPDESLNAFPIASADSSKWLAARRWDGILERIDGQAFARVERDMKYVLGSDPTSDVGAYKTDMMSAYAAAIQQRNWRHQVQELYG